MKTSRGIRTSKGFNQLHISLTGIPIEFMPNSSLNEFYKSYLIPIQLLTQNLLSSRIKIHAYIQQNPKAFVLNKHTEKKQQYGEFPLSL